MTTNELTIILNESKLLPYEIAEAVYEHLKSSLMESDYDFSSLKHIENNNDIMQFYLAAKQLKD